ncbi:MAG: PhzF family phenazine biosynthesis protein [Synergistetes bacterium]|nr:PhzF family phenazine biosynthesis protein [Synergistota bacterium]
MGRVFFIVDVFARGKYSGNQLAVFLNAGDLSDDEMGLIAREMNYSETTFITSDEEKNGGYDVRIFTPEAEVPFAGHPTLGTAYIIREEIIGKAVREVKLNLKVGQIPVVFGETGGEEVLWMRQKPPIFGEIIERAVISDVLGIGESDIDEKFPVQEVSTGLPFIIVPLKSLGALKRIRINLDKLYKLIEKLDAKLILAFCPEARERESDLSVRVFAHYYGVSEDPATGSGNGCLAGYLCKYRYFGSDEIDLRVGQGHEVKRPSLIYLKARKNGEKIDIFVGGKVVKIAKGVFI